MHRKVFVLILNLFFLLGFSQQVKNESIIKSEIMKTEKAFEKMVSEKGIASAFYYYADKNAVILRENDSIIKGKENIRDYYQKKSTLNAKITWTPDFIAVSNDGTMAYTYGNYRWIIMNNDSTKKEYKGIFHTIWKKQPDKTWKYVWD